MLIPFLVLKIIFVPGDSATIASAYLGVSSKDTVEVAKGTYFEHSVVYRRKHKVLTSGDYASNTIIDAQGLGGIWLGGYADNNNDTDCVYEDMTWLNGNYGWGGAGTISNSKDIVFRRMIFQQNQATTYGCLSFWYTNGARVENSLFINNLSVVEENGGVWQAHGSGNYYIINNTFAHISSPKPGSVIRNYNNIKIKAFNNIMWSCVSTVEVSGLSTDSLWNTNLDGTISTSVSISSQASYPMFVDSTKATQNLHLQATSPCINTGYNVGSLLSENKDLDKKVWKGVYDIGCYQYEKPATGGILIDVVNRRSKM